MRWLVAIILVLSVLQLGAAESKTALIYKNEACGHCTPYIEKLFPILTNAGYSVEIKDFINSQDARRELSELQDSANVPLQYRGHMLTVLEGKYLLEGHIPLEAVSDLLSNPPVGPIILYQDSMAAADSYLIISGNDAKECKIGVPISKCASSSGTGGKNLLDHPWLFPALIFLIPIGLIAKYGLK